MYYNSSDLPEEIMIVERTIAALGNWGDKSEAQRREILRTAYAVLRQNGKIGTAAEVKAALDSGDLNIPALKRLSFVEVLSGLSAKL